MRLRLNRGKLTAIVVKPAAAPASGADQPLQIDDEVLVIGSQTDKQASMLEWGVVRGAHNSCIQTMYLQKKRW